jgi:hypothetical protein
MDRQQDYDLICNKKKLRMIDQGTEGYHPNTKSQFLAQFPDVNQFVDLEPMN